jgi:hypothetical protein
VAGDVITCTLADQHQLAEMLGFVKMLLLSTELPWVNSRWPRLETPGLLFLQQKSHNVAKVSHSPSI